MAAEAFTYSRLQDYADCAYRYWLRYVKRLESPSVQAEPVREYEAAVERGTAFHRMIQQHLLGVPQEAIAAGITDATVRQWWAQFVADGLHDLPVQRHTEITLVAPLDGVSLTAKIDLLAVEPGRVVIVDWKTSRKPSVAALKARLQTKVFRWVVSQAAGQLLGGDVAPEQIEMRYWFVGNKTPAVSIAYSQALRAADERDLKALLKRIQNETEFAQTEDLDICRVCAYRALSRPELPPADVGSVDIDGVYEVREPVSDGLLGGDVR